MKRDFENIKNFIGVDKGNYMPVVKFWDSSINFIGGNRGYYMPVVKLRTDSIFNLFVGET
ncbi:hypothetical protein [uncultured Methanobrevibacter sp.]|uniref:hypothetical protein n=1 Tax=uncultured Methanobrevibacter sp. TaxID=253161 RepID=UPI0025FCF989|nr:hypothetical protein [uncultured Methanobrevibacter sp.]